MLRLIICGLGGCSKAGVGPRTFTTEHTDHTETDIATDRAGGVAVPNFLFFDCAANSSAGNRGFICVFCVVCGRSPRADLYLRNAEVDGSRITGTHRAYCAAEGCRPSATVQPSWFSREIAVMSA